MAQQIGRSLLIKMGNGAVSETFTTVCGFDARSFVINNNFVDTTVPDCNTPSGTVYESGTYGVQSLVFSGSGKFDNDTVGLQLANAARQQSANSGYSGLNYQVIVPGWGTFQGVFIIESFSLSGAKEGNMDFEATFRSSGALTFTAS